MLWDAMPWLVHPNIFQKMVTTQAEKNIPVSRKRPCEHELYAVAHVIFFFS